jgi:hypothetical protein
MRGSGDRPYVFDVLDVLDVKHGLTHGPTERGWQCRCEALHW